MEKAEAMSLPGGTPKEEQQDLQRRRRECIVLGHSFVIRALSIACPGWQATTDWSVDLFNADAKRPIGKPVIGKWHQFQSQKEDKAAELVDYAKTLYALQDDVLKRQFPLAKPLKEQASLRLEFANGSRIIGIPEGADQIRSYHPWGLLMDEAAFQPEAGEAYDAAVPVCKKIIVVSSAGPGWFADFLTEAL
jgi:hypothetical protein